MSSLNGNLISSTYQSLIKTSNNLAITGSVQLSDGNGNDIPIRVSTSAIIITGSLSGDASTATSASFTTTASFALNSTNALSSSFAQTASLAFNAVNLNSTSSTSFAIKGSNTFTGTQVVSGSLILFESASFTLPTSQPTTAVAGTAFFSGSFLYIYNGTVYKSSSFS